MLKVIYEMKDGTPVKCGGIDWWKEKFNIQIEDGLYFNPFSHMLSSNFSFEHEDETYNLMITTNQGMNYSSVLRDDEVILDIMTSDFYEYYKFQISYYNILGITLAEHLYQIGVLSDENMRRYSSVLFFRPVGNRTIWDETIPDDEVSLLGAFDPIRNPGGWTDVVYNEDGTFTFIPTPIEQIPVDPNNKEAVNFKLKLLNKII